VLRRGLAHFSCARCAASLLAALGLAMAVAPTGAAAHATVGVEDNVVVYRGGAGFNDVTAWQATSAAPFAMGFTDALQPLIARAGCAGGLEVTCQLAPPLPAIAVDIRLGGGDDHISARSDRSIGVDGGDGNDVISASARCEYAVVSSGGYGNDQIYSSACDSDATGGPGNDTIDMYNNSAGVARGNDGDDRLISNEGAAQLVGGAGGDLLVGASRTATLSGGDNDDDLAQYTTGDVTGGPGHDVVLAYRCCSTLDGGRDGDWIIDNAGGNTIIGGHGNDVIDVSGGGDADYVYCGSSTDTVYADSDDILDSECEIRLPGPMPTADRVQSATADVAALFALPFRL
jgi:Ca2+-binding RTX toxin-like protein